MPATQSKPRSPNQGATTALTQITPLLTTLARDASSLNSRFEIYRLLRRVYRIYLDWKRHGVAKRSARVLADELSIKARTGRSPIRILIEASFPKADYKQKSRWARALEYVYSQDVPAKEFQKFVRKHGGLAGCARMATRVNRKRRRSRRDCVEGDWGD